MSPPPVSWYILLADPFFRVSALWQWCFMFLLSNIARLMHADGFGYEMGSFSALYMFSNGLRGLPYGMAEFAAKITLMQVGAVLWLWLSPRASLWWR